MDKLCFKMEASRIKKNLSIESDKGIHGELLIYNTFGALPPIACLLQQVLQGFPFSDNYSDTFLLTFHSFSMIATTKDSSYSLANVYVPT